MKWKKLKFTNGKYSVSNTGLVKRNFTKSIDKYNRKRIVVEKILKPCIVGSGYLSVSLRVDNKTLKFYVHRLVSMAFIPNKYNLKEVNHKDLNKVNNNANNLEWISRRGNSHHYFNKKNIGVSITKNGKYKARIMINSNREYLGVFNNLNDAKKAYAKRLSQVQL